MAKQTSSLVAKKGFPSQLTYVSLFYVAGELNKGRSITSVAKDLNTSNSNLSHFFNRRGIDLHDFLLPLDRQMSSFIALYGRYKNKAKERRLQFLLSKGEFLSLVKDHCTYCGKPPEQRCRANVKNSEVFMYNGIDRTDSSLGYTTSNSVPCCMVCNMGKGVLTVEQFLLHCRKVTENN